MPPIGSPERATLEKDAIDFADECLMVSEDMRRALRETFDALASHVHDLVEHVEQVWIGRILR